MRLRREPGGKWIEKLDARQRAVIEWLQFIRDFGNLDTTLLIEKAHSDGTFCEAVDAVLETATGPWNSFEALRNFCVNALLGEKPQLAIASNIPARNRPSPFSVPYDMLRALAPPGKRNDFVQTALLPLLETQFMEVTFPGQTVQKDVRVLQDTSWLTTTLWARVLGKFDDAQIESIGQKVKLEVVDLGPYRQLYSGPLLPFIDESVPLFNVFPPNSAIQFELSTNYDVKCLVLLVLEGWRYRLY